MDVYNCSAVRIINKHGKKNATRSVRKAPFDFGMLLSVFRISVPTAVMVFLFLCAPHALFAAPSRQNSQTAKETQSTEEDIQIPDVSTTIEGGTSSLDPQAVPDFTLILPQADPDYLLSVKLQIQRRALQVPLHLLKRRIWGLKVLSVRDFPAFL